MLTNDFLGNQVSRLGFGCMRYPLLENGDIDVAQTERMIREAKAAGVNYFDTAWPYMNGQSETILGNVLKEYPRDSFFLADKYPGHQIAEEYHPEEIFEKQLKKCQVEYFDYYLLHNVYEESYATYVSDKWHIVDYFLEQKRLGRIKHLGFSTHAQNSTLLKFLDHFPDGTFDFCQMQLNYVDWTLQDAEEKYRILAEHGLPIVVMEGLRGGRLAAYEPEEEARLKALRPEESPAAWAFRWLMEKENVKVILSGMSAEEQVKDNLKIFSEEKPLNEEEHALLKEFSKKFQNTVPCTGCRYCTSECPLQLDIPRFMTAYNDICFNKNFTLRMSIDSLPEEKQPAACIGCRSCTHLCPQNIDIPTVLEDLTARLNTLPSWAQMCKERAEIEAAAAAEEAANAAT